MTIENIDDHMAKTCECGSVKFNLLKSGKIECAGCGIKLDLVWQDIDENKKLKSMCLAAADEIVRVWPAHCDEDGYGCINLIGRLRGDLKADLYHKEIDKP